MSVHPSLSSKGKGKRARSVLKRFERLKELKEKGKWYAQSSIFGMPKIKTMRKKLKKVKKTAEAEKEQATEQAAQAAVEQTSGAAKKKEASKK